MSRTDANFVERCYLEGRHYLFLASADGKAFQLSQILRLLNSLASCYCIPAYLLLPKPVEALATKAGKQKNVNSVSTWYLGYQSQRLVPNKYSDGVAKH